MPTANGQDQIEKLRRMQQETDDINVSAQTTELHQLITNLKVKLPNYDWSYMDQMQSGLDIATNNTAKVNILTHFANKMVTDIVPLLSPSTSQGTTTTKQAQAPPRASGFGPGDWHPQVINGNFFENHAEHVIRG